MRVTHSMKRRIGAAILMLPVYLMPLQANASLKDAMNSLFSSTSTSPQAFTTQRQFGVAGGSLTLRPIGKPINIAQMSRPRFDAGCGGIDLYFGSFSFINGEQFEQLLRSIASQAAGFAMKAALQLMCNPCAAILDNLEAAIRAMNALAKNTCAIMNKPVSESFGPLVEATRRLGTSISTAANKAADWFKSEDKSQAQTPTETAKGGDPNAANNSLAGNFVWKAANETFDGGANTLREFVGKQAAIELMMALYGTKIILPDTALDVGPPAPGATSPCGAGTSKERCDNPGEINNPLISLTNMMAPKEYYPGGLPVWGCIGAECTKVETKIMPLSEWGGSRDMINLAMFGVTEPTSYYDYTSDSLAGYVLSPSSTSLSPRAKALNSLIGTSLLRFLLEVQKSPDAVQLLAEQMVGFLLPTFEYKLAAEIHSVAHNMFSKQNAVHAPQEFKDFLSARASELLTMRPPPDQLGYAFNKMAETVKNILIVGQGQATRN